jgi:hypothetical protein
MFKNALLSLFFLFSLPAVSDETDLSKMHERGTLSKKEIKEHRLRNEISKATGASVQIRDIASKVKQIKVYHFQNDAITIQD